MLFRSRVTGECMAPAIEPGDVVIFDSSPREPQNGELVILTVEGEGVIVKRYHVVAGQRVLRSADGQEIRPHEARLEGIVLKIVKTATREPL